MSIHLIAAFLGCIVAATATGMLATRLRRPPRLVVAFWTLASLGLAFSLGAQALGYHNGFEPLTFRTMELGAQVVAPLALCLGLAEVAGRTLPARFIVRLTLPALALIAIVVLGTDPLSGTRFTAAWPDPTAYYQIIPNKLIEYGLAPATALVAFLAIGCTAMRPGQNSAWRPAVAPAWAAGLAALALAAPGLSVLLGVHVSLNTLFLLLCLAAALLTWFAGIRIGRVRLELLREDGADYADEAAADDRAGYGADADWDQQDSWGPGYDEAGDFDAAEGDGAYQGNGLYRPDDGYRPDQGYPERADYPARHGGYPGDAGYPDEIGYDPASAGPGPVAGGPPDSWPSAPVPPVPEPDRIALAAEHEAREQLFGQIAIYTLQEGRAEEFDRLIEQVVELVRSMEHDTLVFIVHAVPSAPMQRILYEVYRDRAAYEEHNRQPYVARFEIERAPLVLATNVIELGLQQAKVSPFPSIDDLFPEPGYDTSGFQRPDYSRYGRPPAGSGGLPGSAR
jgi:quinol monooxygenase YgiN